MTELTLSAQYQGARELAKAHELRLALDKCQRILRAYPKHVRTYGLLGAIYLQGGRPDVALDLFQRVLSADPENVLAYASLGAIYHERGLLDEAVWELERAWELSPANVEVRARLQALYRERGHEPGRKLKPTRGSLARIYMRGQLYDHAIDEWEALLREQPYRQDLKVALAEALWYEGRLDEAAQVCQSILGELPNALKANLILGRIWLDGAHDEEARALLQRAQALDPENLVAQELFGAGSPLPPRVIRLPFEPGDAPEVDLPYLRAEDAATEAGQEIHAAAPPSDI
ncbi:MAG: tetratricopeptide repeat protein [Anaerolineales bacterium]